jgi:uncharacterized protein YndB with AHSA1/START domain
MTDSSVTHATFTLERTYPASTDVVFAAWADPAAKAAWFAGPDSDHQLDFRVGGREVNHGRHSGAELTFESWYRDIVDWRRIVYTSTMTTDGAVTTVSITTVELSSAEGGTRFVLTEQGTFLDGREVPSRRQQGTANWLDALAAYLGRAFVV